MNSSLILSRHWGSILVCLTKEGPYLDYDDITQIIINILCVPYSLLAPDGGVLVILNYVVCC